MKYGLLFDCDGVLVDTREANYYSYLSALEQTSPADSPAGTFTREVFSTLWGKSWREWLGAFAHGAAETVHRLKVSRYPDYLSRYGVILPGLDILKHWYGAGIPTALVSNASFASIEQLAGWLREAGDYDFLGEIPVICPGEDIEPKPAPGIIARACAALNVASGILIDDDITIGERTARRANIPFIHYTGDRAAINEKIAQLLK